MALSCWDLDAPLCRAIDEWYACATALSTWKASAAGGMLATLNTLAPTAFFNFSSCSSSCFSSCFSLGEGELTIVAGMVVIVPEPEPAHLPTALHMIGSKWSWHAFTTEFQSLRSGMSLHLFQFFLSFVESQSGDERSSPRWNWPKMLSCQSHIYPSSICPCSE